MEENIESPLKGTEGSYLENLEDIDLGEEEANFLQAAEDTEMECMDYSPKQMANICSKLPSNSSQNETSGKPCKEERIMSDEPREQV